MFTSTILRENPTPLSRSRRPLKNRNPQPPINEVSPPAMKDRDLQPNLMSPMSHLGGNPPNGPTNPLDVFLSIKRRQHQIPYPERQIVAQLSTKQIHPVGYKVPHRQMRQKLPAKLSNPSLRHPLLIMKLQKRFDLILPIGHHHIVRITQDIKKCPLFVLSLLPLTSNQIPISPRPPQRLIPELPIAERLLLRIPLPGRLRQGFNLPHQRPSLIRRNRKTPSLLLAKLHHLFVIKGRITPKMHLLNRRRNLPPQPPQEPNSSRTRMGITRPQLTMNQLVGFMNKTIHRLKRIDPIVTLGCPLLLLPINLMHLGIHIHRPMRHLRTPLIEALLDLSIGPIQLKQMTQSKATTEISPRSGIRKVLLTNNPPNRSTFTKSLQIL